MSKTGDGNIVYQGSKHVKPNLWDDIRVPFLTLNTGGVSAPGLVKFADNGAGSTGIYQFAFDPALEEELFFACQIPHSWKIGTDLYPHVHWCPSNAAAGDVVWGLEYSIEGAGEVFTSPTQIITVTQASEGVVRREQHAEFDPISGVNIGMSSFILGRVFREAGNVADTYAADAFGIEIDFHYLKDTHGSSTQWHK